MHRRVAGSLCLAFLVTTSIASAQTTSVSLDVSDETGGLFQSAFAASLRSLGDITVVGADEPGYLQLQVIALCNTDRCSDATHYAVTISLLQPWSSDSAAKASSITIWINKADGSRQLSDTQRVALATMLGTTFKGYAKQLLLLNAYWPKNQYRAEIDKVIADIDARCFERKRMWRRWYRAMDARDTATARVIQEHLYPTAPPTASPLCDY